MNLRWSFVCLLLVPALAGTSSRAADIGTAFTYQGYLESPPGSPVNGVSCDFRFNLWKHETSNLPEDLAGGGSLSVGVSVVDGVFTTTVDFGANAIDATSRWLEIEVCCASPCAPGALVMLTPRVELTPAPHALALPGLYTEQNASTPNIIGGSSENTVTAGAVAATISGGGTIGQVNRVTDSYGTVSGGLKNQAGDDAGTTGDKQSATVGGGGFNTASGDSSTVAGGFNNLASGDVSTIGGGNSNAAGGAQSTVGGGGFNTAAGNNSTIGGGDSNSSAGLRSAIGGGNSNTAGGVGATVAGGQNNTAAGDYDTVGGGISNVVLADYGTISGGGESTPGDSSTGNRVYDEYGTIGGGGNNRAGSDDGNSTNHTFATVGGGIQNTALGASSVVSGGASNTATASQASVGGGYANDATGDWSTVGGGSSNEASAPFATVGGGDANKATAAFAAVPGGRSNIASGPSCTIGGGFSNTASLDYATIAGGAENSAGGVYATVGGGQGSSAGGAYATVPGGRGNAAASPYSLAAGRRALAVHQGAFVWADSTDADFSSTDFDQYLIRAAGGVGVNTNAPTAALHIGGTPGVDGIRFPDGTLQTTADAGDTLASLSCADGEMAKWDSGTMMWECAADSGNDTLSNLSCASGQVAKWNGSVWACANDDIGEGGGGGDITAVNAGTGLTGGGASGDVTLSIATGGVTGALIFDGTIAAADLGTDSVAADEIATGAVGASEIADGSVGNADLASDAASLSKVSGGLAAVSSGNLAVNTTTLYVDATNNRVGINLLTPSEALDVNGHVEATGQVRAAFGTATSASYRFGTGGENSGFSSPGTDVISVITAGTERISVASNGDLAVDIDTLFVDATSNYVGIGTNDPFYQLHVKDNATGVLALENSTNTGGAADTGAEIAFRAHDGTVTRPFAWLGGFKENSTSGSARGYISFFTSESIFGGSEKMRIQYSGNVGIGTTAPDSKLVVSGFENGTDPDQHGKNAAIAIKNTASGGGNWYLRAGATGTATPAGGFSIANDGGYAIRIASNRRVGIERDPTTYAFEVEGDAGKTVGGSDWVVISDRRIKTDIEDVRGALETLDRVHLVSFEYTPEYKALHPEARDRRELNVIAQEYAELFPDYVRPMKGMLPDGGDALSVDLHPLKVYSVAAIQELHKIVKDQKAEIDELRARLEALERANGSGIVRAGLAPGGLVASLPYCLVALLPFGVAGLVALRRRSANRGGR